MMASAAKARELKVYGGAWIVAFALVMAVGCIGSSPPVAHLHGKVTIDGKPVPSEAQARIIFKAHSTGTTRSAKPAIVKIVNGEYDALEVPVGKVVASFDIQLPTGRTFERGITESKNLVPPEHEQGVPIDVEAGDHPQDFEL